ncbi:MAG: lysostaphin resistance A-like protein [Acidobacteriaceae bacterium]
MSLLRGPGRGSAFLRFLLGSGWVIVVYYLSSIAAHGFSRGAAFPLIRNVFAIFLLIIGYGYMELSWDNKRAPLKAMGLGRRPGTPREIVLGAALGWGMVVTVILIAALAGTFYVQLSTSSHAWKLLVLEVLATAAGTLAAEIAFRGYPFQKLIETTGPFTATILAGIFFGLLRMETPGANPTAMWISAVAAVLLSVAYLRTHALWLGWGLHFAWVAGIGILFGQPLAGNRHASSVIRTYVDGPAWLTGGEFGPEASLVALIVLWLGLYILIRMTRDLAWKYGQPELEPAGLPVDLGHPMQQAPPPSVSAPTQNLPVAQNLPDEPDPTLAQAVPEQIPSVQADPSSPASSPASSPDPEDSAGPSPSASSNEPAETEMEQRPKNTP